MSLLSHDEIEDLLDQEIIEYGEKELINSASLDIRLGLEIMIERPIIPNSLGEQARGLKRVTLRDREPLNMVSHHLKRDGPYILYPGEFILAHSHEVFNLPNWLSASYALKSSMARIGLEHLNAGWCDAGWNGSVLTLEFKNLTRNHEIVLHHLDKIGQICFFSHKPVSMEHSYATRGRYNGDKSVSGAKIDPILEKKGVIIIGDEVDDNAN